MPDTAATGALKEWAIRSGDTLRMERHRRRLSQAQVAEKAGVDQTTVSKVESGGGLIDSFVAIARALNVGLPAPEIKAS